MGRPKIAIQFVEFDNGCMVPMNMALNQDGYFRRKWGDTAEMFHRFIYRAVNKLDEIPKGYEINHKCRCRACCNPEHLELLDRTTHLILTNKTRYKARNDKAKKHWLENNCSGTELGEEFNVTESTGCRWIRNWLEEVH